MEYNQNFQICLKMFTFNFCLSNKNCLQFRFFFSLKQPLYNEERLIFVMDEHVQNNHVSVCHLNLKVPMRKISNTKILKKCNQCDYSTCHAGTLNTHLKTHSREKPNKCSQCDYASCHAGNLSRHLKIHSEEKPNKCNQCDYV